MTIDQRESKLTEDKFSDPGVDESSKEEDSENETAKKVKAQTYDSFRLGYTQRDLKIHHGQRTPKSLTNNTLTCR